MNSSEAGREERAAFEEWAKREDMCIEAEYALDYDSHRTHVAWCAWQPLPALPEQEGGK